MASALGSFVLGLLLLALGGDSIVKGAAGLAQRLGIGAFATGLLLVAFGTSLPELAVNARAVWTGNDALALGNAVGSNIVNFGLTLGAAALAAPLLVRWRALAPLLLGFIAASALVLLFGRDGSLGRGEGVALLALFVAALAFAFVRTRHESAEVRDHIARYAETRPGLGLHLLRVAVAVVLLYFGARWVVSGASALGAALGMAPLMAGLVPVAIGTALPEVSAAVMAARRGHGDMVAGHVVGSSLFNLLLVLGGMAALHPLALPASFVLLELPAALALALALYPMLKGDLRISRLEGGILLAAFAAWLSFELLLTPH